MPFKFDELGIKDPLVVEAFRELSVVLDRLESSTFTINIQADTLAAQADNYDIGTASFLPITLTGDQTITGFAGGKNGRLLMIFVTDTVDSLTLAEESASSDAGNRIQAANGANIILPPLGGAILIYYLNRWRVISTQP